MKRNNFKRRNPIAKDLWDSKYRMRKIKNKKKEFLNKRGELLLAENDI